MYPDNADAEVRRIRLSSQRARPRRHRTSSTGVPLWVLLVIGTTVLAMSVAGVLTLKNMLSSDPMTPPGSGVDFRLSSVPVTSTTTVSPSPAPSPTADLVASAQKIKPLEDITKGDRVIYQSKVCTWQEWEGNIGVSKIKCGREVFQIQTGRLTPVELKDGPSKLKVRH